MLQFICVIGTGIVIAINVFWLIQNVRSGSASKLQIILSALWIFLLITVFVEILI